MFFGVHLLLYSRDPEADRAFFRDVLGFTAVDVGHGWMIFAMPPAEMAVHPSETPTSVAHVGQDLASGTVYLMCNNLAETLVQLQAKGVQHGEIQEARWGVVTSIPLPGGGNLGLYEPRHPLAIPSPAG
jgi:catechol 2,3-dioxygenase-like lactoylglutathione lyase family enzyme